MSHACPQDKSGTATEVHIANLGHGGPNDFVFKVMGGKGDGTLRKHQKCGEAQTATGSKGKCRAPQPRLWLSCTYKVGGRFTVYGCQLLRLFHFPKAGLPLRKMEHDTTLYRDAIISKQARGLPHGLPVPLPLLLCAHFQELISQTNKKYY